MTNPANTVSFLYRSEAFAEDLPNAPCARVLPGHLFGQADVSSSAPLPSSIEALALVTWPLGCALLGVAASVWGWVP